MKNIVVFDELNELDVKPSSLLQEYLNKAREDVRQLLINTPLKDTLCPGCRSDIRKEAFEKFGLTYSECGNCHSLYVSPRPNDEALNHYYKTSQSRNYWREEFSEKTSQKRKEKIIKPRFEWIFDSTLEYLSKPKHWVDINTSQYGYIDEMLKADVFEQKTLVNSFLNIANTDISPNTRIIDQPWWEVEINDLADVVSIFEVADHIADVDALFAKINGMLKPNGLCFMTVILSSGFDLQVLWDKAANLYPPDRLNVFSVDGLKLLFDRHHFECLEFSTPGVLDVDIVAKALKENPGIPSSRFLKNIVNSRDENVRRTFQEFLQANLLSSYGRILLRKTA